MTKLDHYLTTDRDGEDAAYRQEALFLAMDDKLSGMTRAELAWALARIVGDNEDLRCEITERTADWDLDKLERFVEGL